MLTTENVHFDLTERYANLCQLLDTLSRHDVRLFDAESLLAEKRAKLLCDNAQNPKFLGANAEQREASLMALTLPQRDALAALEREKIELKARVEIARLRLEQARANLRLLEVATGIQRTA